ncbi:MAG: XdhC family protein [Oscillospiraceae bacterium]|nr:XdhC family protein [Oscillospiraceae bacterium]
MNREEIRQVLAALAERQPAVLTRTVDGKEYVRRFLPEERLILLGAGHVSQATAKIAHMMGFSVTVVDDRPEFANFERFPEADTILCTGFTEALEQLKITPADYVCTLTRGHRHDAMCVRYVLSHAEPYYLGMIGSRHRVSEFFEVLRQEGYPEEKIASVHAPIGLPIRALTREEIGLSIVAQLVQEKRRPLPEGPVSYLQQTNLDMETLRYLAEGTEPCAAITVLASEGSTPAKPGAMMTVNRIGAIHGTVGGGCSEAELMTKARRLIGTGGSNVIEINMTNEVAEENGMVCGGHMWALAEDVTD